MYQIYKIYKTLAHVGEHVIALQTPKKIAIHLDVPEVTYFYEQST